MTYLEYLKWRIQLFKYKNVILFPIEKTLKDKKRKNESIRKKTRR